MSQSELQYAGEYLIDECKIISTTGQPFDIIDIVRYALIKTVPNINAA